MWKTPKNYVFCIFWGRNLKIFKTKFMGSIAFFKSFQMPFSDFKKRCLYQEISMENHQHGATIKSSIFHKRLNLSAWKFDTKILWARSNFSLRYIYIYIYFFFAIFDSYRDISVYLALGPCRVGPDVRGNGFKG